MTDISCLRFLLIPFAIFIPGGVMLAVWGRSLLRRLDFSETLFVQILFSILYTSFLALILAEIGRFTLVNCLAALLLSSVAVGWLGLKQRKGDTENGAEEKKPPLWPRPRFSVQSILLFLIIVVAAWLYFRPAEAFLVLDDGGVYLLSGINLAETGELFARDFLLQDFTPSLGSELLFSSPWTMTWRRFWGPFYLLNWGRTAITFGFFDLYRIWVALFVLVFGRGGAPYAAPAFGLLSTIGIYFLGRRLFDGEEDTRRGSWIGLLGAAFLTLNFAQLWNVRYPLSEAMTQYLVIGGFYLLDLLMRFPSHLLALACGVCFGTLFLARVDTLPVIALVAVVLLLWRLPSSPVNTQEDTERKRRRSPQSTLLISLSASMAYAIMHNLIYARQYLNFQLELFFGPGLARTMAMAGGGLITFTVWAVLYPKPILKLRQIIIEHPWRSTRIGLIAASVLVALSLLLWPLLWPDFAIQGNPHLSLLYWTPVGLVLAVGGLAMFALRKREKLALPFWAVSVVSLTMYALNPFVNPLQPWATRRLVPTVLPALAMFSAYAVVTLPRVRFNLHRIAQCLVVVSLLGLFIRTDLPFVQQAEYSGCLNKLEDLANHFEPDGLLLFEDSGISLHISQPLHFLFGLDSFVLQKETPDTATLRPFLKRWWQDDKPIYLLISEGTLAWYPPDIVMVPDGFITLKLPRTGYSLTELPSHVGEMNLQIEVYRLLPLDSVSRTAQPILTRLEMEPGEYPYCRDGLHRWEVASDGTSFRWTDGLARLVLGVPQGENLHLRLRVAGGRTGGVEAPALSVWAGDTLIGETRLDGSHNFTVLEFPLPDGLLPKPGDPSSTRKIEIEVRSDSWVPSSVTDSADSRTLGVAVDWVEVTSGQ